MNAPPRHAALALLSAMIAAGCPGTPPPCTSDRTCSGRELLCDREQGICVECLATTDCDADEVCLSGDCKERIGCTSSRNCEGLVCDPARGYCVECVAPEDCAETEECRAGSCVPLPCTADGGCG